MLTHSMVTHNSPPQLRPHSPQDPASRRMPVTLHALSGSIEMMGATMPFARNAEIYGENERAEYVYKVLSGSVRTYKHWVARKPKGLGGKMTQRTFGVITHGEQQAFELAVKARKAWEAELKGRHVHHAGVGRLYAPGAGKTTQAHRRAKSRAAVMRTSKGAR